MKISEITGRALDYAVALAEGRRVSKDGSCYWVMNDWFGDIDYTIPQFTSDQTGDEIIDREKIGTEWVWSIDEPCWQGWVNAHSVARFHTADGATRREAAMRAYVASKLGDEIEIPEGLQ